MSSNYATFDPPFFEEVIDDWETDEAAAFFEWLADDMEEPEQVPYWADFPTAVTPWLQNGFFLVAVALLIMVLLGAALSQAAGELSLAESVPMTAHQGGQPSAALQVDNPTAVVFPYDEYILTQGLHGQSYGHLAIDLSAGRGTPVQTPINGFVTELYVDEYGNTTLVIENDIYRVTLLHGDFSVAVGDELVVGQVIGLEGNNGYTMDMLGNLCYGRRYCGNHTHLNIYDKRIEANVNPFDVLK